MPDFLQYKNLYGVPSVHFSAEFALKLRRAFFELIPDTIAIELPPFLQSVFLQAIDRLPVVSVIIYPGMGDMPTYLPVDPCDSMVEALALAKQNQIDTYFVDMLVDSSRPVPFSPFPDPYVLNSLSLSEFYELIKGHLQTYSRSPMDLQREAVMAHRIYELMETSERVLWVGGLAHWEHLVQWLQNPDQEIPMTPEEFQIDPERIKLANLSEKSLPYVLGEVPLLTYLYTRQKDQFSKTIALKKLYKEAEYSYFDFTGETLSITQYKLLMQYVRNLALIKDQYFPDFMEIIRAAKACVSDDYAWDVYETGRKYPPNQNPPPDLPTIDIQPFGAIIDGETIRIRRHLPRLFQHYEEDLKRWLPERPQEDYPGQWRDIWDIGQGLWGHIPDDNYQEAYFDFIRRKAKRVLTEEQVRIYEFTSSLMDGIDYRETIRNFYKDKLYVREYPRVLGKIGATVVIFDTLDTNYPFWEVLYAEHDKESDLLMYSSYPGEQLIGPGISRVEVGGFAAVYPSQQIEVNPNYDHESPPNILLLNALDWSKERFVVYVSDQAPSARMRQIAGSKGKTILFMPLDSFSPSSIKRLRRYHLLRSIELRKIAKRYIRDPKY
ncbi:MAG: hypothetical protein ACFFCZ_12290 [Promethearchaeota archaeon]